jgi:hypothetical protein
MQSSKGIHRFGLMNLKFIPMRQKISTMSLSPGFNFRSECSKRPSFLFTNDAGKSHFAQIAREPKEDFPVGESQMLGIAEKNRGHVDE